MTLALPDELNVLTHYANLLGCDDPVKYMRELTWVDVDLIRDVGQRVWGANGTKAEAQMGFETAADRLDEGLYRLVLDHWQGAAATQFEGYMKVLESALNEEADRLQPVGAALVAVADAFEKNWYEIVGYGLAVVGLIIGGIGIITAWVAGAGLILAVIGMVLGVAGLIVAILASLTSRLDTIATATSRTDALRSPASGVDVLTGAFPRDIAEWRPRPSSTAD